MPHTRSWLCSQSCQPHPFSDKTSVWKDQSSGSLRLRGRDFNEESWVQHVWKRQCVVLWKYMPSRIKSLEDQSIATGRPFAFWTLWISIQDRTSIEDTRISSYLCTSVSKSCSNLSGEHGTRDIFPPDELHDSHFFGSSKLETLRKCILDPTVDLWLRKKNLYEGSTG